MDKKNIVFIDNFANLGGVEKLMQTLVWEWHDKFNITILTIYNKDDFYNYYPKNVKHICLPTISVDNTKLTNTLNTFDTAIAIKNNDLIPFVANLECANKIAWFHNDLDTLKNAREFCINKTINKNVLKKFNTIFCVSEQCKKSVIKYVGDTKNLKVALNPINEKEIIYKSKLKPKNKILNKRPLFVSCGRIANEKNFEMLIDVFVRLWNENYSYSLCIIGDGPELTKLKLKAEQARCPMIQFLGYQSNPYPYVKLADWFITTTKSEGCCSYTMQEAALLDVPLLVTNVTGANYLCDNNKYGIIMDISEEEIYKNVKKVLDDESYQEFYKKQISKRKSVINYKERIEHIEKFI